MPIGIARMLATDDAVGSEELEAAILYLDDKLRDCALKDEPVPFLTYRNKVIFQTTLQLRYSNAV
ncbi:MAG: hypothetical protein PW791_15050 [Neorhizobium sp.]|jgi:hypothetical protein|nr:hypothetical protein [Neorhizobium sp.]